VAIEKVLLTTRAAGQLANIHGCCHQQKYRWIVLPCWSMVRLQANRAVVSRKTFWASF